MTPLTLPASEFHSTWSPRLNVLVMGLAPILSEPHMRIQHSTHREVQLIFWEDRVFVPN
jgi:hypothetical protein